MLKIVRKAGGWLFAAILGVRWIVDLLESIKATKHYADFLYCHRYSAFILFPKSILVDTCLFVVGLGLIFSDRLLAVTDNWWPRVPNIKCHKILRTAITWDEVHGCYIRRGGTGSIHGILLEIANEVERGRSSPPAGRVKAQIIFHFHNKQELRAAPAAWMDEPLSSVELAAGDTRWLIVATGFDYVYDWKIPFNRRSDLGNPTSFEYYDIPGLLGTQGTAEVQLLSMETNRIFMTFVLDWEWKPQQSLEMIRFTQMKARE